MKKLSVKSVVAIGIGAALFFVLGKISIPTPVPNTYISLQYAVQAVFAMLFGPIAGLLIGLVGPYAHRCDELWPMVELDHCFRDGRPDYWYYYNETGYVRRIGRQKADSV